MGTRGTKLGKKREKLYTFIGVTFYFEFILELITEFHSLCKTKENKSCLLKCASHENFYFVFRWLGMLYTVET